MGGTAAYTRELDRGRLALRGGRGRNAGDVRATGIEAAWDGAAWRQGEVRALRLLVGGEQVVGARGSAIADPAGGATIDGEARAAVAAVIAALRTHGLIG